MGSVSAKAVVAVRLLKRPSEQYCNDGPRWRRGDGEFETAFEVGLIEAGEGHARVHGDEEGVEVFLAVVVIFEASDGFARGGDVGGEFCFDEILASVERGGRKDDVPS